MNPMVKQNSEGLIADVIVISTKSSRTIENTNLIQLHIFNNFLILPLHCYMKSKIVLNIKEIPAVQEIHI